MEGGDRLYYCEACSRENLRSIEAPGPGLVVKPATRAHACATASSPSAGSSGTKPGSHSSSSSRSRTVAPS